MSMLVLVLPDAEAAVLRAVLAERSGAASDDQRAALARRVGDAADTPELEARYAMGITVGCSLSDGATRIVEHAAQVYGENVTQGRQQLAFMQGVYDTLREEIAGRAETGKQR